MFKLPSFQFSIYIIFLSSLIQFTNWQCRTITSTILTWCTLCWW